MTGTGTLGSIDDSRTQLLGEIAAGEDLTLVRGPGNVGDLLILAGTRALLADLLHREVALDDLPAAHGETALLVGSGAWSRRYNEWAPEALAIAERRFERVVVLPSTFDTGEERVREALRSTRATVYAREHASHARIAALCRARLAHDAAFFADLDAYARLPASGVLDAFRTDAETAAAGRPLPAGNRDLSATSPTLDAWLREIAAHATVRTDRAHVLIAAARMGRRVEWSPDATGKVEALATAALADHDVHRADPEEPARAPRRARTRAGATPAPPARVTAVVLTRDRPADVATAVTSVLTADVPLRVLVLDQNSSPAAREANRALDADPRVEVRSLDRNLGCAGGRRLGTELADTEYVLFLDDDAELRPGALEHLVADLDAHPEAGAATAKVVLRDGRLYHFGGTVERGRDRARFVVDGHALAPDDPAVGTTGPTGWMPGTAALVRRSLLERHPLDDGMRAYYEDNEWSLRVLRTDPDAFRRVAEAQVVHADLSPVPPGTTFASRSALLGRLAAHARFMRRHGCVLDLDLHNLVPGLADDTGRLDVGRARLLLSLVDALGPAGFLMEWCRGGLDALLVDGPALHATAARLTLHVEHLEDEVALRDAEIHRVGGERDRAAHERDLALGDLRETADRLAAATATVDAQATELAWLHERDRTLRQLLDGRWWRLRRRLEPVARVGLRARGTR